jgi:hypothetical protein
VFIRSTLRFTKFWYNHAHFGGGPRDRQPIKSSFRTEVQK